ncbi:unnamed protein product, partial [Schistosoma curassoni]|uniref:C2H2-type domain-containing protein n=1 Tax=Schistosoma curassoni TaxID=6186 RepID=A0A183L0L3_9TREM
CPIQSNNNNDNNNNDHIHCRFWPKCNFINLSNELNFQILYKHFLSHNEYLMTNSLNDNQNQNQYHVTMDTTYNNLMNPKRRGRPPKYAKHIYVPHINPPEYLCIDNQYTIDLTYSMFFDPIDNNIDQNVLHNHVSNYNTICYMSTNKLDLINIHRREFHQHTIIEKGFEYYDISIDCRRPLCHNNKINKHFHCIYPNCDYTFIRSSTMQQHLKKHTENLKTKQNIINKTQNTNQSIVAMATNTSSSIDINIMNNNNNTKCNHSNNIQSMNSLHPIDIHSQQLLSIPLCNHQMNNDNNDDNNNNVTKKDCTEDSSLPGLQPNWTAAMVTDVNDVTIVSISSPVKIDCSSECTNECL